MSSFLGMFYFNVEEVGTGAVLNQLNFKASCRLATDTNINLPDPASFNFGGFILQEGERLLVRAQTNEAQNGIYKRIGNELFRTSDCDTWEKLVMALVPVESGNFWKGTFWLLYVEQGGTLEVDDISVLIIASSKDMSFSTNFIRDGLSQREIDLSNTAVTPGTHSKVTVDQKGRVTAGATLNHNEVGSIQGGTTNQYYHLTATQHSVAANLVTAKAIIYPLIAENNLEGGDWHKQMIITITKNDNTGVSAGEYYLVHLWFSKTDFGSPDYDFSGSPLSGVFTVSLMQGKMISPETFDDKVMMQILTANGGEIIIEFEGLYEADDVNDIIYLIVEVQGRVFSEKFILASGV